MRNYGGTEDFVKIHVISTREKAIAACQIGTEALKLGQSHSEAADFAGHEFLHARAHRDSGVTGLQGNTFFLEGYYSPDNGHLLSSAEKKAIATAVGEKNMSDNDKKFCK